MIPRVLRLHVAVTWAALAALSQVGLLALTCIDCAVAENLYFGRCGRVCGTGLPWYIVRFGNL